MLANIVGGIFVLFGALFFLYPEFLRRRLCRKTTWRLRRYFFVAALTLGILCLSVGWKQPGLAPKLLMLVGMVAIVKGLLFLNARAVERATAWILARPVVQLRIFAVGQIVLGGAILFGLAQ